MLNDVDGLAGRVVCESEDETSLCLLLLLAGSFLCGVLFLSGRRFNRIEDMNFHPDFTHQILFSLIRWLQR